MNSLSVEAYLTGMNLLSSLYPAPIASIAGHEHYVLFFKKANKKKKQKKQKVETSPTAICLPLVNIGVPSLLRGSRVVRWCWVNFQCRGVLLFGLQ